MKAWLFVGAKVVVVDFKDSGLPDGDGFDQDEVVVVREVVVICGMVGVRIVGRMGQTHPIFGADCPWDANCFRPVSSINTDATVAALKQAMRDHLANASGGLGIRGKIRA